MVACGLRRKCCPLPRTVAFYANEECATKRFIKSRRSHSPFGLFAAPLLSPRILEMAPVCTHRVCVEGLGPTLLWMTAHTHLNKQLSQVVMRDETTERHGSAAASWPQA